MSAEPTMEERATRAISLLIMNQNENNPSGHRKGLWLDSPIAQQEAIRLGQFVRSTVEPITHEGKTIVSRDCLAVSDLGDVMQNRFWDHLDATLTVGDEVIPLWMQDLLKAVLPFVDWRAIASEYVEREDENNLSNEDNQSAG
tara:strand:+ start:895 stop:1323 length:429 start_codon:yes stop_codon:yes gene_type:complete